MNDYLIFGIVCVGAFTLIIILGVLSQRIERERTERRMREVLSEARDNRVREMSMGWGDGADVEPRSTDDDCKGCD